MDKEHEGAVLATAGYTLGRLLGYLRAYRRGVAVLVACLVGSVTFGIVLAWLEGQIVDRALIPPRRDRVRGPGGRAGSRLPADGAARPGRERASGTARPSCHARSPVAPLHPPPGAASADVQRLGSGDLLSRVTHDLSEVEYALNGSLVELLRLVLTLVLALAAILWSTGGWRWCQPSGFRSWWPSAGGSAPPSPARAPRARKSRPVSPARSMRRWPPRPLVAVLRSPGARHHRLRRSAGAAAARLATARRSGQRLHVRRQPGRLGRRVAGRGGRWLSGAAGRPDRGDGRRRRWPWSARSSVRSRASPAMSTSCSAPAPPCDGSRPS